MKKHLKIEGVVIRRVRLNEADLIVSLLSKAHGKVSVLAKGARRIKSKFCGRLELFNRVHLTGFSGRNLVYVNEVEVMSVAHSIATVHDSELLFALAELNNRLIADDQQVEGAYPLLLEALEHLKAPLPALKKRVVLHTTCIKLLTKLGFMPLWNQCNETERLEAMEGQAMDLLTLKWVNFMQQGQWNDILRVKVGEKELHAVEQVLEKTLRGVLTSPLKSMAW